MKTKHILGYSIFLLILSIYAKDQNQDIIGIWQERNLENSELIEFPNTLKFNPNKTYSIFNKVYAPKSKTHIIEKGKYKNNNDTITFYKRKFFTTDRPYGSDSTAQIIIINRNDSIISIGYLEYGYELQKIFKIK